MEMITRLPILTKHVDAFTSSNAVMEPSGHAKNLVIFAQYTTAGFGKTVTTVNL